MSPHRSAENLIPQRVREERMRRGLTLDQLATQAGVSREDSYRYVQRNAMKVWEQGADFLQELLSDAEVRAALSEEELREKFDLGYHTKHVDTIFRRVFGDATPVS